MSFPAVIPSSLPAIAAPEPAAALPAVDPAPGVASAPCRNCGTARLGEYCHGCGQHFLEDRLTVRLLASEAWERVTFERGFLRTFVDMTVRPGVAVRRYVEGQRRRYVSPVTYLLFATALSLLCLRVTQPATAAWVRANVPASGQGAGATGVAFTAAQSEAIADLTMRISQHATLSSLGMGLLFALLLRLAFRRSGINLVEAFVFALFTFAQVLILGSPLSLLVVGVMKNVTLYLILSNAIYLVVCGLAAAQYFGRPVRSVLKTAVALAVSYYVFSVVVGVAVFAYVLINVR